MTSRRGLEVSTRIAVLVLAACSGNGPGNSADDAATTTGGWHLTTYFTAVESFFSDPSSVVTGCMNVDCTAAGDPDNTLGTYPDEFVATVQAEGTGRTSTGSFLNWSASQPGSGYWLDTAPRDAQGDPLVTYVSAAAHPTYELGTSFRVVGCGVDQTTSEPMDAAACTDLTTASWQIHDRFESDTEIHHLDLYLGLQDTADMNDNPHFVDQIEAMTTLP